MLSLTKISTQKITVKQHFQMKSKDYIKFIIAIVIVTLSILIIYCGNTCQKEDSELLKTKNKISKTWQLYKIIRNNCYDYVEHNKWIMELSPSGDCFSIYSNILGENESRLGKWEIINNGKIFQINNYFITSKPIFLSTWYKIIKISDEELWLESASDDKEKFIFKSINDN